MMKKEFILSKEWIERYVAYLWEMERSVATIRKYRHDLDVLCGYLQGMPLSKVALIGWKQQLSASYAPATVNGMLTAVNHFLRFIGMPELSLKLLKLQKPLFQDETKELTRHEYIKLVKTAERQNNRRLSLLMQTICATGIRVSELRFITVEAVQIGRAEVNNKGKRRLVFLPTKLCQLLANYVQQQKKTVGPIFTTRTGKPLDRSNIWREMKQLCASAAVPPGKVFPHNLRHLFARIYYTLEHDLSRLADILGHSSISTTRIYTAESGKIHAQQLERLQLIIT